MSEPRKQHYVPQTYLKKFAYLDKKPFPIYTKHKDKSRIIPTNVGDVACEKDFYTINDSNQKYEWERIYAESIEPLMKSVLNEIINLCDNCLVKNHSRVLNDELKYKLSYIIIHQLLRGKQSRAFEKNVYERLLPERISEAGKKIKILKEKEELLYNELCNESCFRTLAMQAIFNIESLKKMTNALFHRSFHLFKITDESEYITSDNPIMFMDSKTLKVTPFTNGLIDCGTVVFYPISPKILLATYHKEYLISVYS